MTNIGIVEGFFGPTWSFESRVSFAEILKKYGGSFYIYAPKRDAHLRKAWREEWETSFLNELTSLKKAYQNKGLKFGVALSPFGLGRKISTEDWQALREKFKILSELKIDYLGLFFDDMPSTEDLLKVQTEVVNSALQYFPHGLIFCPSYYSFDPILDKVFGPRPEGYVEGLKESIPEHVEICWTGPKVISDEISSEHLLEVNKLLGRKPFIWENIFANDGPKNCKFLKLKYFTGRDSSLSGQTSGVAFNLLNQPYLSQVLYLSSLWVIEKELAPEEAFSASCVELCTPKVAQLLISKRSHFLELGLDKLTKEIKEEILEYLIDEDSHVALEIKKWLRGEYLVGAECLTD